MSRKRGRRQRASDQAPGGASPSPTSPRGLPSRAWWIGAAVAALVAAGLALWLRGRSDVVAGLPPPAPPPPDPEGEYLGSDACADCHLDQYARWASSTHGRAGGDPSPEVVVAPFDGTPIAFRDGTVEPRVTTDGEYLFVVRQEGHEEVVFRVDGVIGRGHMLGGGTQGFVTEAEDGTVRFLPFDWSATDGRWFCNTGTRLDRGWLPIQPDMRLADCGDWPPVRVLGTVRRFGNCQGCHGSQIRTTRPPGEPYETSYTSLAINCESCHGPGTRHVELALEGRLGFEVDAGFRSLAVLDTDGSLDVCFQCHALKDVVRAGHASGQPLEDHYALKFPLLGDEPFFPDFRVKTFAYQGSHLSSACYLDGSMTCVSCHEPHGQGYQDEFSGPLVGRFDDGQCTSCHASKARDVQRHTFHPAESEGSRCVACHMPYLQQPEVGPEVSYARSDHTIPVPRPAFDSSLGVATACATCHATPSDELARQAAEWWGTLKPHRPLVRALAEPIPPDRVAAAEALLRPDQHDPLAQFAALARFLEGGLDPDDPTLEPAVEERLRVLARTEDLDVRALALASLHWARGDDPGTRELLARALGEADAEEYRLRQRWVLALSSQGDAARAQGDSATALAAFRKALEVAPGDPRVLQAMGQTLNQAGAYERAIPILGRSAEADPNDALSRVNLGIALAASGDVEAAAERYADAARINPVEPLAFFNLGNLYLRQSSPTEAALAYERAVALNPGLARGHYNLAIAYIQLGRIADALRPARRALELEPGNRGAAQMLRELQRALAGG